MTLCLLRQKDRKTERQKDRHHDSWNQSQSQLTITSTASTFIYLYMKYINIFSHSLSQFVGG